VGPSKSIPKPSAPALELDLGRYELRRNGRRLKIEKKPMELLIFLVARRNQLVPREDIVAKLWRSDLFINAEPNINNVVRKLRTALGDHPAKPRFLETVVGKGYRFIGPLRVVDAQSSSSHSPFAARSATHPSALAQSAEAGHALARHERSERPSLAVMPLLLHQTISDDRGVSLGFADALASRLGNLQDVDVLPASAVLALPAEMSATEVAERLGVRFVVRGAIRGSTKQSKDQWRLSLEMFDAHRQTACLTRQCDLELERLPELVAQLEDQLAAQIAATLNRPLRSLAAERRPRYTKDPVAYAEFTRGFRLSSSGDPAALEEAAQRLATAITRDPGFSLAHATLSLVCATRHFEFDPGSVWLERAEFHCRRALQLDPDLPEGHLASAFLLWGPSKNFQHLAAIAELRRALALQPNLPHAYNRLGTILAHIGLLDRAREMYQRGRPFHPQKAVSHSIVQVYVWNGEYDLARAEIEAWRAESPANKYPLYFSVLLTFSTGDWKEARRALDQAVEILPEEPLILSLQALYFARTGKSKRALEFVSAACASPKSFGHAHHNDYQIACVHAVLGRPAAAFEWLERSVATGFACWPYFLNDPCLQNLRSLPAFEVLITSLQSRYPDHLGLL
jgi:DNA-binding winged helix-turn-helix (wHTH) protein/Flp pilus assembly protein TadD